MLAARTYYDDYDTSAVEKMPEKVDIRLKSPCTAFIAGPTGSGKTEMIKKLIDSAQSVAKPPAVQIVYCYRIWQERFRDFDRSVVFHEGMIEDVLRYFPRDGKNRWLIIDDLMSELVGGEKLDTLFTNTAII